MRPQRLKRRASSSPKACAHVLPPPGGPEDKTPPRLIAVVPESLSILPDYKGDLILEIEVSFEDHLADARASMQSILDPR